MSAVPFAAGALPSRTAHILGVIKSAILNGDVEPGAALVENDLAREFGVSKTPVREALKVLEGTGLVVIRPYTGTFVRELTVADALAIYDLRLLLEPEAVRRTVATGVDLDDAAAALQQATEATEGSQRSLANRAFHRALYAGCGNPLLIQTLDGLRDQTALVAAASWAHQATWRDEAAEHADILAAATAGDADEAARLVAAHIDQFSRRRIANGSDVEGGVG
ncbi:GntR family transcriptional regulator [Plantibacter sp. MCCC 1A11337]|uniref:GntR family transcriptional regulator n=1 Tax=Plantibacter sp. MCCC 1A11337 TaxID=2736644 RepID=UPI001582B750|nr:GntR family transcriptional regulator [Plantibacter sp. MCCC 1A11337]NUJ86766.1 GntR family transcriptional regulator [Plantibacter sp. MCCC 1A11337]